MISIAKPKSKVPTIISSLAVASVDLLYPIDYPRTRLSASSALKLVQRTSTESSCKPMNSPI